MGPEGAAQPCRASREALKFLEQSLVQRRVGNRLHRLLLPCWEAPGQDRLGRRKPRPPASSLLGQARGSPHTQATPEDGTDGWSAAWGAGGCLGRVGRFWKAEREASHGAGDSLCEWRKALWPGIQGTWAQDSYETDLLKLLGLLTNALGSRTAFKDRLLPSGLLRTCFLLIEELRHTPGKNFQLVEKTHRVNAKLPSCPREPPEK